MKNEQRSDVRLEPDVLPVGRAVGALALVAIATVVGIVIAWRLLRLFEEPSHRMGPETMAAPRLLHGPIAYDAPELRPEAEAARSLSSYGWVDRERGLVRIPIERAFDIAVASSDVWLGGAR